MWMLSVILSLCLLRLASAQDTGAGGQFCRSDIEDGQCPGNPPNDYTGLGGNEIECSDYYECCYCEEILCGAEWPDINEECEKFQIDGYGGAYGVPRILIIGDRSDGVKIECTSM